MILHIAPDGNFIDSAIKSFEKASPKNNKFVIVTNKKKLYKVKSSGIVKMTIKQLLKKDFISQLSDYEFIVIHVLTDYSKKLILEADTNIKFLWIGWGFDYYKHIKIDLFLPQTLVYVNRNECFFSKKTLRKIRDCFNTNILYKGIDNIENILKKISYFTPVIYEDFILLKNQYSNIKIEFIDWNYGNLEDLVDNKDNLNYIISDNILLGNSATPANNHLEAIDILKDLELSNRIVITPMSYGEKKYAKKINDYGGEILKDFYNPLMEYMPLDEYNQLIKSCSVVIMNHLRQQGVGNIVTMLYYGAKVFLNKKNPVYNFFIRKKVIIFSMEELNLQNINLKLSDAEVKNNRRILEEIWSEEVMILKTKDLITKVNNEKNVLESIRSSKISIAEDFTEK